MPVKEVKPVIHAGSTVYRRFECVTVLPESSTTSMIFEPQPVIPTSATVKLWSVANQALVDIGGEDVVEAEATIGNEEPHYVEYLLPAAFTQEAGDYKLEFTVGFADGQLQTKVYEYKVRGL